MNLEIQQVLTWAAEQLSQSEQPSATPRLDAEILLSELLQQSRTWLYTWPDKQLQPEQWQQYQHWIAKRQQGQPVAYLIGCREFWGLTLKVSPDTLIPRPDTERLVELALQQLASQPQAYVADLGTGTGAIALALASEQPQWQITAADFKPEVVTLAEQNRQQLGFNNVTVIQSDWCQALPDQHFDLIVSNPPYIEADDPHLQQGDVRFEPLSALTSGADGLDDIRKLAIDCQRCLKPSGWLMLEHGYNQAEAVQQILLNAGYQQVHSAQDLAGQDRVTLGCYHID